MVSKFLSMCLDPNDYAAGVFLGLLLLLLLYFFLKLFFCFLFIIYYILIFLLEVGFTRDTDPSGSVHMYGPTSTLNVHTLV